MSLTTFDLSHEAAFIGYALFAALVALRGSRSWHSRLLLAAVVATALWSQLEVAVRYDLVPAWLAPVSSGLRDGAWLGLCLALMRRRGGHTRLWEALLALTVLLVAFSIGLDVSHSSAGTVAGVRFDSSLMRLALIVIGLVLVENIARNSSPSDTWALKHLLIGVACIFAFQLFSRIPEFLTHTQDPDVVIARPLILLMALPLFVVSATRFPNLQVRIHSSRAFVFHSATLIAAGILLQGVAVAAWYVRQYGGSNATVLAIILLFGGAIGVAVPLASGSLRSRVRLFINENFFSLKYDYRVEWEKVIRALSLNPEQDSAERVLRTLCDLLDCPGGALWIYHASWHQLQPAAKLGFDAEFVPISENDARLESLRSEEAFIKIADTPENSAWRRDFMNAWIVVPLRYRSSLAGLVVLNKPRAAKSLDWEDESLVRLAGLQLGAYLVQEETAQSLADARQLEEFNKRFAFIVHDIKNTIGQLSLLVQNIAQFGDKQEFRDDMVETLRNAVERLQQLLKSLTIVGNENVPGRTPHKVVDLVAFIADFAKQKESLGQKVKVSTEFRDVPVELGELANLHQVIEHVVNNAMEASSVGNAVDVQIFAAGNSAEIHIVDHGPGMTEKFVNEELFRPMRTTKDGGMGIGAYQARELMRDLGGDVRVSSKIGKGTTVILSLPLKPLGSATK